MPSKSSRRSVDEDPLSIALAPPSNETPVERESRLLSEQVAKQRSDAIDEELDRQRIADKKGPKPVKILLLGQSESGKSTTLKNFQLMHSPKAFRAERASWRAIIQLNVVRSIRYILDAMTEVQEAHSSSPSYSFSRPTTPISDKDYPKLTPDLLKLKMRLSPLLSVEESLTRILTPAGSAEIEATYLAPLTNLRYSDRSTSPPKEPCVNSTTSWKDAFGRFLTNGRNSLDDEDAIDWDNPKDPGVVLHACSEDIKNLWNDPTIKTLLEAQKLRLEEMPGFFLDSLDRVVSPRYIPSDDDILRARLKTLGVSEHRFQLKAGNMLSHEWRIFDVGGQRSLRAAWAPFFDDMDAIIFLAPISCFDQVLAEDRSVNRLEDSILLWKSVVSNPLLKKTNMVLFLNKCDILRAKLASGIKLAKYVVSYGDRPNDFNSASNYLRKKFAGIHKQCSPLPRTHYCHLTSVIDTRSTTQILGNVQDMLVQKNLELISLV